MAANIIIRESAVIHAAPSKVYDIIRDYRVSHPAILPTSLFKKLTVLEGGVGEGTVFTVETETLGQRNTMTMRVTEPKRGEVLREQTTDGKLFTDFIFEPLDGGAHTRLTFHTEQVSAGGLRGWVERLLMPRLLRGVYIQELKNIDAYAQK